MKIAIIGFGWLGLPLGKSLKKAGHEVLGTTTSTEKLKELEALELPAKVLNLNEDLPQDLKDFFENSDICILNFPPNRNADAQGRQTDIEAYGENALKAVSLFSENTRFIFIGSTGIYPDHLSVAREIDFDRAKFVNSNSMAFAEESLYQKLGKKLTVVRMAGLIGENRHIGKYFAGKQNIPNGDSPVNLIHLTDCIRFIECIIERNAWGETFNACATQHPSRRDYYTFCCEKFGLEKPDFSLEENPVLSKKIDNSKSKKVLDFEYLFDDPYEM